MAEVTIRLISNPKTGRRDIYIDYHSEDDALPFEHESEHRALVEQLLGKGVLNKDELGQIYVGRLEPEQEEQANPRKEDTIINPRDRQILTQK